MEIITIIERMLEAGIILLIGGILSRIAQTLTFKVLHEAEANKFTHHLGLEVEKTGGQLVGYATLGFTIIVMLQTLGVLTIVGVSVLSILAILLLGSLLIESMEILPNVRARKPALVGKTVNKPIKGKVIKVGLIETLVENKTGRYAIQNREF